MIFKNEEFKPNTRHALEANAAGLSLIGSGLDANNRLYRFTNCGHVRTIQTSAVRRKEFSCSECVNEKLKKEASDVGLELIGNSPATNYRMYKFKVCGHVREMTVANVRLNDFKCVDCYSLELIKEAGNIGLELIGAGSKPKSRLYKFKRCGHVVSIRPSGVRRAGISSNKITCFECLNDTHKKEAINAGVELLGEGSTSKTKLYKFTDCGHVREIRPTVVRIKGFICERCEETSRTKPSNVYLLKITSNNFTWLKLGHSKNIAHRAKQYGLPADSEIEIVAARKFDTGDQALNMESAIHKDQRKNKLCPDIMREYHARNGFSECYPLGLLDTIKSIILIK